MDSLSVLFFLSNLKGGGAERVAMTLLQGFQSENLQSSLFLLKNQIDFVEEYDRLSDKINVAYATNINERIRNKLPEIWVKCKSMVIDSNILVGGLELDPTYFAFLWAKLFSKPIIGWVHTPIKPYLLSLPRKHSFFVRTIYPRLDRIVFPSRGAADSMIQYLHLPLEKIRIIPNPINIDLVNNLANAPISHEYYCSYSKPIILSCGRLEIQKGFDLLIQASWRLIAHGYDHILIILGEGSQRQRLLDMASELNIRENVILPGFLPNPFPLLKAAKLFVSPSRIEGFGQAILEALALGIPVVATDCNTGPSEIIDGGKYGMLVETENIDALVNAMESMFSDEVHDKFSSLGCKRALDYSPNHIASLWKDIFYELIN